MTRDERAELLTRVQQHERHERRLRLLNRVVIGLCFAPIVAVALFYFFHLVTR